MNSRPRFLMTLGLAARAGKVASGEQMTENAIHTGTACVVFVAKDASENTRKHFEDQCKYYDVPIRYVEDREVLGNAIGKDFRASAAVIDENLASLIMRQIDSDR